jgi:hypothetical protein
MKIGEAGTSGAMDRLRNGGRVYIDFALENPDYYELMFNMPEPRNFMTMHRKGAADEKEAPDLSAQHGLSQDFSANRDRVHLYAIVERQPSSSFHPPR